MKATDDRGKFDKINQEAEWDNYAAHIDDNKRKELANKGYDNLNEKMPCPKCGKPMLRANQLSKEKNMESNPWFIHTDAKGNKVPMHKNCATK